ncbi:unnamed protein product (macronuclear) [Paramecium tetraurelia]|uniref:Uncharacterized protein n=1 Tax=Paramecium tetraurelia TaxID=5888 RepID=A0BP26_PARTE|nr:uncharacterized protein GSPATT00005041001 [Paramecium tetraurelia]CAK60293.1 unnamed protein product [Paramecium tetraurelia]|eukprot:XP_001427691.1 hypothetical protein (macronuclear) [Paramecium tetraurelia strain d4-2]
MKKKQVKSKSPTPIKQQTTIDTPKFKEKASQQTQMAQFPKNQIESEYFSFSGIQQYKKQSKSVHELSDQVKKLNKSFTKDKKVSDSKTQKVQIFNNNYQIININQIEKKESIRSLQREFKQILERKAPNKASTPVKQQSSNSPMQIASKISAYPSANNYFQRIKKLGQSTLLRKKF